MADLIVWVLLAIGPGLSEPLELAGFGEPETCEALASQLELVPDNDRRYDCPAFILVEKEDHASN